jgi:hypothetical protein
MALRLEDQRREHWGLGRERKLPLKYLSRINYTNSLAEILYPV